MSANAVSQAGPDVYGQSLSRKFGAEDASFVLTRSLRSEQMAVTELRVETPPARLSEPIERADAYMICLKLRNNPRFIYWEDGRQVSELPVRAGQSTLHDLRRQPLVLLDQPVHTLVWYLPCSTLDAVADQANVPRIRELRYDPGVAISDNTIFHLGLSLLPALQAPDRVNRLYLDYVAFAFAAHAAETYGGLQAPSKLPKGGLAPWQEKRAKDLIAGDLTGAKPLHDIADACGLSVSHFSRAFRRTTGLAPHAWLLQFRVDAAKALLRQRNLPLSTIARKCGFVDQSHLSRVFLRRVGLSPGAWRDRKSVV